MTHSLTTDVISRSWFLLGANLTLCLMAGLSGYGEETPKITGTRTRGGDYHPQVAVTSLEDSGPGTLRQALEQGHRKIVFRVAGTVTLASPLVLSHSQITLEGTSAPTPGVTISSKPVIIKDAHDVKVVGLRFRDSDDDNLRIQGACENIQIDHCSSVRAGDGALDITQDFKTKDRPKAITVSWCLFAGTEKAMLVDSARNLVLQHNLFTNNAQRNPQFQHVEGFDVRHNVVRAWNTYGLRVRGASHGNIIENVFGKSSNRTKAPQLALIIMPDESGQPSSNVYLNQNTGIDDHWFKTTVLKQTPFTVEMSETHISPDVEKEVLDKAGVRPLDDIDRIFVDSPQTAKFRVSTTK